VKFSRCKDYRLWGWLPRDQNSGSAPVLRPVSKKPRRCPALTARSRSRVRTQRCGTECGAERSGCAETPSYYRHWRYRLADASSVELSGRGLNRPNRGVVDRFLTQSIFPDDAPVMAARPITQTPRLPARPRGGWSNGGRASVMAASPSPRHGCHHKKILLRQGLWYQELTAGATMPSWNASRLTPCSIRSRICPAVWTGCTGSGRGLLRFGRSCHDSAICFAGDTVFCYITELARAIKSRSHGPRANRSIRCLCGAHRTIRTRRRLPPLAR
jgi:hypothetical protein